MKLKCRVVAPAVSFICDFSLLFNYIEAQILHLLKRGNNNAPKLQVHVHRVYALTLIIYA